MPKDSVEKTRRVAGRGFALASFAITVCAAMFIGIITLGVGQASRGGSAEVTSLGDAGRRTDSHEADGIQREESGSELGRETPVEGASKPRERPSFRLLIPIALLVIPSLTTGAGVAARTPRSAVALRSLAAVTLFLWTLLFIASAGVLYLGAALFMVVAAVCAGLDPPVADPPT